MAIKTRIQEVGFCSICGRRCAVRNGRVSVHGYQKTGMGFFTGECMGSGRPHYGSNLAPKAISEVIELLDCTLRSNADVLNAIEINLADINVVKQYSRDQLKDIKKEVARLKANEIAIPDFIEFLRCRLNKWTSSHTSFAEVDSQGRTAEEWVAIKQAQENKKAAKIEADKIKRERAEKAEENRMKKVVEYEALISSDNHYRLFYEGALIDSWVAAYDSEHDIYEAVRGKVKAHWLKVGHGGGFGFGESYKFFADGRTAAEGKGKRFFQYLVHGTAKAYFDNYSV